MGETENRELEMEAFVLPNQVQSDSKGKKDINNGLQAIDDNTPLESFHVPPDSVERYFLLCKSFSSDTIGIVCIKSKHLKGRWRAVCP